MVVTPAGRARRHRAHALVCGRAANELASTASESGRTRAARQSQLDIAGTRSERYTDAQAGVPTRVEVGASA